jgi:hypothetical protein
MKTLKTILKIIFEELTRKFTQEDLEELVAYERGETKL